MLFSGCHLFVLFQLKDLGVGDSTGIKKIRTCITVTTINHGIMQSCASSLALIRAVSVTIISFGSGEVRLMTLVQKKKVVLRRLVYLII